MHKHVCVRVCYPLPSPPPPQPHILLCFMLKSFTLIVFLSHQVSNRIGQFGEHIYDTCRCDELCSTVGGEFFDSVSVRSRWDVHVMFRFDVL